MTIEEKTLITSNGSILFDTDSSMHAKIIWCGPNQCIMRFDMRIFPCMQNTPLNRMPTVHGGQELSGSEMLNQAPRAEFGCAAHPASAAVTSA